MKHPIDQLADQIFELSLRDPELRQLTETLTTPERAVLAEKVARHVLKEVAELTKAATRRKSAPQPSSDRGSEAGETDENSH